MRRHPHIRDVSYLDRRIQNHQALILLNKKLKLDKVQIQDIVDYNILPYLLTHLDNPDYPHLNLEACSCIAKICTGSRMHIESLVNKGLFDILPKILQSKFENIFEQGAWAVGNISVEDAHLKGLLLERKGILEALDQKIRNTPDERVLAHTTWALCNLLSGSEMGTKEQERRKPLGLLALFHVLKNYQDLDLLQGVLGAIADNLNVDHISGFINAGLVPRLFEVGKNKFKQILQPVLRIVAMITNGTDAETGTLIQYGGIEFLFDILSDEKTDNYSRTKCLWILSNIVVGPYEHRDYIFRNQAWVNIIFSHAKLSHQTVVAEFT